MENQKRVKELTEKYGAENMVVVLGAAEGLRVYHVSEPEIKGEVDEAIYDDQVSMMEMVIDVDDIISEMSSIREQFCKF